MAVVEPIAVPDLRPLVRLLKETAPALERQLQQLNRSHGAAIAGAARAAYGVLHPWRIVGRRVRGRGGKPRTGRGSASIRATATSGRASVQIGSPRAPYMLGQEFGSRRTPNKRQFPPYIQAPSGRGGAGYFFYPTLRREVPPMRESYMRALDAVLTRVWGDEGSERPAAP